MMKTLKVAFLCLAFSIPGAAKSLDLLDYENNELPSDAVNCEVAFSEEHAEKQDQPALKIDFKLSTADGSAGEFKPKKNSWKCFKKLKFIAFNPSGNALKSFGFFVKGAKMTNEPDNRKDWKSELPPGRSEHSFNLPGTLCNDGKTPLDYSTIFIWKFRCKEKVPATVYILRAWLE